MEAHHLDLVEARRIAVRAQLLDALRPAVRNERRLRSLGIARDKAPAVPLEPNALGQPFSGRTALLSPFDRLVHNRARAVALFDFEYVLEMYKPKAERRWGYYALPVLHHDMLVGKVDATTDRRAGVLHVHAIHQDVRFTADTTPAVHAELADLASWLGLTLELTG